MRWTLLLLFPVLAGCVATPQTPPLPHGSSSAIVLGAIGNSLMLGYNADAQHVESAPEIAWATGNESWSFAARLHANGTENVAAPGAGSRDYVAQAAKLRSATLVLVLLPADNLCAPAKPGADASAYEHDLREGTRGLLARGIRPMLITPPDIVSVAAA